MELKQTLNPVKSSSPLETEADLSTDQLRQRVKQLEKVNKELKKTCTAYKEEITQFKESDEAYQELENYQKLITDFNNLYDHYQVSKQMNKRLRYELQQGNARERCFIKLLKQTS